MSIASRCNSLLIPTGLLAVLSLVQPLPALAQGSAATAMANAIARMMESMGFKDAGGWAAPGSNYGQMPTDGWPQVFGNWPGMAGAARQFVPMPNQGWSSSGGGSPLEGVWEDNQGGLLIVQGEFYRIYSSCNGSVDGDIRIGNDRIDLVNRRENLTQSFEYALDQGRLVLRSRDGQVFLYRRLILNRGS